MLALEAKPASDGFAPCWQLPAPHRCLLLSYLYCCNCAGSKANPCFQGNHFYQFVIQPHDSDCSMRTGVGNYSVGVGTPLSHH